MILASCRQFPDNPAFTCMGKDLSFKKLDEYSRALAAFLQSRGLVKGDRVAVMMPNILHYPIAFTAILRAGFVVVNVNPLYTPRELEHQLNDSGAKALIVLENFASTVEKTLNSVNVPNIIVASMGDMHGFKGHIINFVVRRVKKMVPVWNIRAISVSRMHWLKAVPNPSTPFRFKVLTLLSCNIQAVRRASRKAPCSPIAIFLRMWSRCMSGWRLLSATKASPRP